MYEDKKYEAGRVEITSEEYRDLVKEAIEARNDASHARSDRWKIEIERDKIAKELELANKKIAELESLVDSLQTGFAYLGSTPNPYANIANVTCKSSNMEDN